MEINIDRRAYPFESRYMNIDGHRMHYVDEGSGEIVLFSHGTPEWSFAYRHQIKALSGSFRCIAPDLLGFGLSDKPVDADYSVAAHAGRMEKFIAQLGPEKIHIVANDFGGSIALSYATRHPEKIGKICIFNTWMWPLNDDPHYTKPSRLIKSVFGKFLYLRLNFPVRFILPKAYGNRKTLTKEIHRYYRMTTAGRKSRIALYKLAKELMDAGSFWKDCWREIEKISAKPFLICWGKKDPFIPFYELEKWKPVLRNAEYIEYPEVGHFLQEEVKDEFSCELKRFLS